MKRIEYKLIPKQQLLIYNAKKDEITLVSYDDSIPIACADDGRYIEYYSCFMEYKSYLNKLKTNKYFVVLDIFERRI